MSFLEQICQASKSRVPSSKALRGLSLEKTSLNFFNALERDLAGPALIGEIKKASPSEGQILPDADIEVFAGIYGSKAAALSILTEPEYFHGSLQDLRIASQGEKPCLRKDFLVDPAQVLEARHYGASAYLLIVAALSPSQLEEMIEAGKEFDMPALVEVHDERELEIALRTSCSIIGINNRDLHTLKIHLSTSQNLSRLAIEAGFSGKLIAESGYSSRNDIEGLPESISATLIGTSVMKSDNPQKKLEDLFPGR